MKKYMKPLLWLLLLAFLAMSYGGFNLRTSIENANHSLITVADYYDFRKASDSSNISMSATLDRLKEQGVTHIGVKEISLRELALAGRATIYSFYEFQSYQQLYNPTTVWAKAQAAIDNRPVTLNNLVICTGDSPTADFILERLGRRYEAEQIIYFNHNAQHYIILNAALSYLDRRKDVKQEFDAPLGFDPLILEDLAERGFEIVLRPENITGSLTEYFEEYRQMFSRYHTKYLVFSNQVSGYPDHVDLMADLVRNFHLIVGVIETSEQIKYIEQPGLEKLLAAADYPINRVYSTGNDEFVKTVDDRYYRWIRAVVDRGIRIVYLSTFKDNKLDAAENLNNTIDTVGRFHGTIAEKGYAISNPLPHLNAAQTGSWQSLMLAMSLLLAGLLYLAYLFPVKPVYLLALLGLGTVAAVLVNFGMTADWRKVYALGGAVLYPAFSSLLLLRYLKEPKSHSWPLQILISLALVFIVNLLGAYTVVSSLNDIRFIMNLQIFTGVKLAFLLPLGLFIINYFACFTEGQGFIKNTWQTLQQKPNYLVLVLCFVLAAGVYYYLGRSGNNIVEVSALELRFREFLEMIFLARPRFKEFLIGYPAIVAMVYLYHKYKQSFILFLFGIGVVMGSISMINSFCHVFTAVSISWSRSWLGLVLGTVIGLAALLIIMLIERILTKYLSA